MTSAAATTSTTTKAPTEAEDFTTTPSESTEGSSTDPTASSGSTSLSGGGSDSSSEPGEDSGSGGFGCNGNSSTDPSRPLQPSPELQPQKQAQLAPQQQPLEAPQKPAPSKSPASSPPEENLPPKLPDDGLKGDEGEDPGEAGEEGVQGELTHGGASQDETDALEKQEELHPVPADNDRNGPSSSIVGSPKPTQHLTSTPKLLNRETAPPPPLRKNISLLNRWMRQQCKPNLSKILAKTMLVKMPRFLRRLSDVETSTLGRTVVGTNTFTPCGQEPETIRLFKQDTVTSFTPGIKNPSSEHPFNLCHVVATHSLHVSTKHFFRRLGKQPSSRVVVG
ncbi:hypothetical protein TGVAND_243110 [Toxoplasma gondii VAND]|uniref:Toxoplasma gondii family A protein n=1 Tax=Toxoplasma gondii VAND TaxID=933077 RepID=A0A086PWX8_TOXGO|nr:hypothetical protein TGVAND_243110 [Toxoplasma gondii VAND]